MRRIKSVNCITIIHNDPKIDAEKMSVPKIHRIVNSIKSKKREGLRRLRGKVLMLARRIQGDSTAISEYKAQKWNKFERELKLLRDKKERHRFRLG